MLMRPNLPLVALLACAGFACAALTPAAPGQQVPTPGPLPPSPVPGLDYATDFFPGARHDPAIPTPDSILGFPVGQRAATHAQIQACLKAWAGASSRCALFEYARSYENRALSYLVISSPANIQRLDAIKADMAKLADPRKAGPGETDRITANSPAIAWMAYTIHGDEMSSSDAALAAAWHLIAGQDAEVTALLDNLIIIIDPLMNPDGRDRWLNQQFENRTAAPSLDDQSLLHAGSWPWGRTNHYLFDLNRDWILGVHPESRGRIAAIGQWHPQLLLESHEQEPQDTFLFSPPRAPFSPHLPKTLDKWYDAFSKDNAKAFDRFGWRYYTGEWNEGWYPGYSGSWAAYRGAIESLYEQARVQTDAVRRAEGTLDTYREAVHRQVVATFANLNTLRANKAEILKDFAAQRRENLAEDGPFAKRTFAVLPSGNQARLDGLLDKLLLQGFELYTSKAGFTATGKDQLGRAIKDRQFPAGTILIPGRQPEARLLAEMLEFDPRMPADFLNEERRELLRFNRSKMYDVTAWNLTMLHGVEACELATELPADAEPYSPTVTKQEAPGLDRPEALVGWVINGDDDRSVAAAARLMERGVQVRASLKPFELEGRAWPRGSLLIARIDNRAFTPRSAPPGPGEPPTALGYTEALARVCTELGLTARGVDTGLSPGDLPDLGGEYFPRLEPPSIAVLAREPFDVYSYGEIWFTLDRELAIRASYLDGANISGADLRRYNVIILPAAGGDALRDISESMKAWVKGGGTLIAIGPSAGGVASEKAGLSSVRQLPDVLAKLDDYDLAVQREWLGLTTNVNPDSVWSHTPSAEVAYPWPGGAPGDKAPEKPSEDELKKRDKWESRFMPQGAILAARTDDRHWMTFGCGPVLPVLYTGGTVLMAAESAEAPVRFGAIVPAPPPPPQPTQSVQTPEPPKADPAEGSRPGEAKDKAKEEGKEKEEPKPPRLGWANTPPGHELRLRMSGLLWPEAARRLGHSAFVTQERLGDGQIILFAASPTWRGGARGTARLLTNAAVYGPGLGASHPIKP
ncbi:MAG: peptidase [Phycisphaerales bacterium]|nr:peptidase [Phycisphaerales bacterium]